MHVDTVSAYKLRTAQQYAEAAGSLVEELDKLMLRRPMPITNQSNPGARAAYAQTLGNWYLENAGLFTAVLIASRLLNDRAAADLDDLNEAADAQSGPSDGPNTAGYILSPCPTLKTARMPPVLRHQQVRERIRKPPAGCCSIGRPL